MRNLGPVAMWEGTCVTEDKTIEKMSTPRKYMKDREKVSSVEPVQHFDDHRRMKTSLTYQIYQNLPLVAVGTLFRTQRVVLKSNKNTVKDEKQSLFLYTQVRKFNYPALVKKPMCDNINDDIRICDKSESTSSQPAFLSALNRQPSLVLTGLSTRRDQVYNVQARAKTLLNFLCRATL